MGEAGLKRAIGPFGAALIAFNGIVGAGIFMLPGLVHTSFGAFGPWLFPIFGLVMLLMVLPLAAAAGRPAGGSGRSGRRGWVERTTARVAPESPGEQTMRGSIS